MIIKRTEGLGSWRTIEDHPNLSFIENDPEYLEEFWRVEETCCHSISSESLSAKTDVKNSDE